MWGVLFFMFGTGFGVCCACRTVPQRLRLRRGRCGHRSLRTRLQIGRRGDYQSPTGSRVQGSIPNAPTVGRGAHTPPLPSWCNHRGTGRNGPGTAAACGHAALRPQRLSACFAPGGGRLLAAPTTVTPVGWVRRESQACSGGLFGIIHISPRKKEAVSKKETASVQFIPLR